MKRGEGEERKIRNLTQQKMLINTFKDEDSFIPNPTEKPVVEDSV